MTQQVVDRDDLEQALRGFLADRDTDLDGEQSGGVVRLADVRRVKRQRAKRDRERQTA